MDHKLSRPDNFGAACCDTDNQEEVPAEAVAASLGCGNPTAVAELRKGERVLLLHQKKIIIVLLGWEFLRDQTAAGTH